MCRTVRISTKTGGLRFGSKKKSKKLNVRNVHPNGAVAAGWFSLEKASQTLLVFLVPFLLCVKSYMCRHILPCLFARPSSGATHLVEKCKDSNLGQHSLNSHWMPLICICIYSPIEHPNIPPMTSQGEPIWDSWGTMVIAIDYNNYGYNQGSSNYG